MPPDATTGDPETLDEVDGDEILDDETVDDDDVVVLAWWQHPLNLVTMLVAVALIAGMVGWLVHDTVSAPDKNDVDVGFLQDMRVHHEQATQMSLIFLDLPDTDPGLRTVATTILVGQDLEIGRMIQLLRDFDEEEAADVDADTMTWMGMAGSPGEMPGMATDEQIGELRSASGRDADELFVELMTAHHRGGISMAEYAAEHAANSEVRTMAESMVRGQQGDIAEMEQLLNS